MLIENELLLVRCSLLKRSLNKKEPLFWSLINLKNIKNVVMLSLGQVFIQLSSNLEVCALTS